MSSTTTDTAAAETGIAAQPQAAATPAGPYTLIVKHAFADYQVGQEITAAAEVAAVLAGENAANVLKRSA